MFAMYYIFYYMRITKTRIGLMFMQNHATVIHAIKTTQNLISYGGYKKHDEAMRSRINLTIDSDWMERVAQL